MESKSVNWEIEYKITGSDRIYIMKIELHFNKVKNIAKWFKMTHAGKNGQKDCEFINAKIIEENV
jgi:hypothetical protein